MRSPVRNAVISNGFFDFLNPPAAPVDPNAVKFMAVVDAAKKAKGSVSAIKPAKKTAIDPKVLADIEKSKLATPLYAPKSNARRTTTARGGPTDMN